MLLLWSYQSASTLTALQFCFSVLKI